MPAGAEGTAVLVSGRRPGGPAAHGLSERTYGRAAAGTGLSPSAYAISS
jgi:hypothetical protein